MGRIGLMALDSFYSDLRRAAIALKSQPVSARRDEASIDIEACARVRRRRRLPQLNLIFTFRRAAQRMEYSAASGGVIVGF
jgi:hypothetical protein